MSVGIFATSQILESIKQSYKQCNFDVLFMMVSRMVSCIWKIKFARIKSQKLGYLVRLIQNDILSWTFFFLSAKTNSNKAFKIYKNQSICFNHTLVCLDADRCLHCWWKKYYLYLPPLTNCRSPRPWIEYFVNWLWLTGCCSIELGS